MVCNVLDEPIDQWRAAADQDTSPLSSWLDALDAWRQAEQARAALPALHMAILLRLLAGASAADLIARREEILSTGEETGDRIDEAEHWLRRALVEGGP